MEIVRPFTSASVLNAGVLERSKKALSHTPPRLKTVSGPFRQPRLVLEIQNTNSIYSRNTSLNNL